MQRNTKHTLMNRILVGLLSWLMLTTAQAEEPVWTIRLVPGSNPAQTVLENQAANVQYIVQNQSGKPKRLVIQSIPGIAQTAPCQLAPNGQAGSSCILTLAITGSALPRGGVHGGPTLCQANPDGSPNSNQCYQPSAASSLNITSGPAGATISLNTTTLLFAENSMGEVTVTNNAGSPVAASNVAVTIPASSFISVQSTTCGASLAIGASCTITFASGTQEGPTTISVSGSNTNTVNVDVTVTSQPVISITSPEQQNRIVTVSGMTPLSLGVTNGVGSAVNANAITVSDKTNCPDLIVNDSNCASVAPGDSCTLQLTSATPYAPCTITVSGGNTANSPTTPIAFFHENGLVFEESAGSGKVVTGPLDDPNELTSQWSSQFNNIATDLDDGAQNTTNIISNDPGCTTVNNCAALRCRNISADWYLPALTELSTVHTALCSNTAIPCNFGGFSSAFYWSSSQVNLFSASNVFFPSGSLFNIFKNNSFPVRCVRAFSP